MKSRIKSFVTHKGYGGLSGKSNITSALLAIFGSNVSTRAITSPDDACYIVRTLDGVGE